LRASTSPSHRQSPPRRALLAAAVFATAFAGAAYAHPAPGDYADYPPFPNVFLDYKPTAEAGEAIALQRDGLVVVAGTRSRGAGPAIPTTAFVWRLWPWGDYDESFGGDGVVELENDSRAEGVAVQQDGKIVVGGTVAGQPAVWRLEADGTRDVSFGTAGRLVLSSGAGAVAGIALQDDDTLVVAGHVEGGSLQWNWAAWKVDPFTGALDPAFGVNGQATLFLPYWEYSYAMTLQADGKIVIAGHQSSTQGGNATVLRLLPDGTLDRTFDGGGIARFSNNYFPEIHAVTMAADGKIVLGGGTGWTGPPSTSDFDAYVARLRPNGGDGSLDGAFDHTFNNGYGILPIPQLGTGKIYGLAMQEDGKVVAVGRLTHDQFYKVLDPHGAVYRINVDGTLDAGFWDLWNNPVDYRPIEEYLGDMELRAVAIDPEGRIVMTGWAAPELDWHNRFSKDLEAPLIRLRGGDAIPQ
jgi:uncharacterized delta-60 repeat protein